MEKQNFVPTHLSMASKPWEKITDAREEKRVLRIVTQTKLKQQFAYDSHLSLSDEQIAQIKNLHTDPKQ